MVGDIGCKQRHEAEALRRDLRLAGIARAVLFERSGQVEPLRFHDLRATFVTWARRAGKDTGWITDRTGHLTPDIMHRYDRGARSLADLQMKPFPATESDSRTREQRRDQPSPRTIIGLAIRSVFQSGETVQDTSSGSPMWLRATLKSLVFSPG